MRIVLILVVLALVPACGGSGEGGGAQRTVLAAFYPLAYVADRIAGPASEVRNLTPPGVEPHDFELSARDVAEIGDAELVLYLGQGFQPALERAIETTGAEAVDLLTVQRERDPHVWLDPHRLAQIAERVANVLGRAAQGRALAAELEALDREFARGLAACERRELVTSHAAFGYLAARYDLEQVAITGLSPEAEPTPGELRAVVEEVRAHGATTVFFETLVSPRLAETVAREVDATAAVLNPLEGLTEEELARGEDYFSVMRSNLAALQKALGCPPR